MLKYFQCLVLIVLVSQSCVAVQASEHDSIRDAMRSFAQKVKKKLDFEQTAEIAIGEFKEPASHKLNSGVLFQQLLIEEFEQLGVRIRGQAKLGITGEFFLTEVPASDRDDARIGKKVLALRVPVKFQSAFGTGDEVDFEAKILESDELVVRGTESLVRVFAPTVSIDPLGTEIENDRSLRDAIVNGSSSVIEGTLVKSTKQKPFAIEVIVHGKVESPTLKDGNAILPIKRGQSYAIRIHNFASHQIGVSLFIDGISVYAFSEIRHLQGTQKGQPRYSVVLVPPASQGKPGTSLISGWHRNNESGGEDSFLVTEYAKSAAGKLNRKNGIGQITAVVRAAWSEKNEIPKDEPGKSKNVDGPDATGFGKPTGEGFQEVSRELGVIRDVISVRY